MDIIVDCSKEKLTMQRIQHITLLCGLSCFSTIIDAILYHMYTKVAVVPIPPNVEKTKGEKEHDFICFTWSSYGVSFSNSFCP